MHKGVILLVKAGNRNEAKRKAVAFLNKHVDTVWDWYQIGGRWTGALTGYDPEQDPKNIETCPSCEGTGVRTDMKVADGCNQCHGAGKSVKWPTSWVEYNGDISPGKHIKVSATIQSWGRDWAGKQLATLKKSKALFKDDPSIQSYLDRVEARIKADEFSFNSNVFDIEHDTNKIPRSLKGFWAVMVDMHN